MTTFWRRHSYHGGKPPATLLARLHSAPTAPVGIPAATLALLIRAQVQLLRALLGTIAELESRIATRLPSHPRATQLASLPAVDTINLAQLLAEVGPILDRVSSAARAWLRVIWACWQQATPTTTPRTPPLFELQPRQLDSRD
jgi:transposase